MSAATRSDPTPVLATVVLATVVLATVACGVVGSGSVGVRLAANCPVSAPRRAVSSMIVAGVGVGVVGVFQFALVA